MQTVRRAWGDFLAWRGGEKTQNVIRSVLPRNPFLRRKSWTQACLAGVALIRLIATPMTDRLKLIKLSILPGRPQEKCQGAEGWGVVGQKGAIKTLFSLLQKCHQLSWTDCGIL